MAGVHTERPPTSPYLASTSIMRRVVRPPLCARYVPRPQLFRVLDRVPGASLTLVAAPAGFGKSTLLSAWAAESPLPVAWLSLARAERDPAAFSRALVSAVRTVSPDFGDGVLGLWAMSDEPTTDRVVEALTEELSDLPESLVLVLDEADAVGDSATSALLGELTGMLPDTIHLVLASRSRPDSAIGLLRERGRLLELGPRQLRLTPGEVEQCLAAPPDLGVSPSDVTMVTQRTEGWPGCVGLVAAILGEHADPRAWLEQFGQARHREIDEFLLDAVLATQPPSIQHFLLCTSIVDSLSGGLADAMLGDEMPAEGSRPLLERLCRIQQIVEPLESAEGWYQYPALFRDVLRRQAAVRLAPATVNELHRRASLWLVEHGYPDGAVRHALESADLLLAAKVVEQSIDSAQERADFPAVERKLSQLPPDLIAERPKLILARAWTQHFRSRFEALSVTLAAFDAALQRHADELDPASMTLLRAGGDAILASAATAAGNGRLTLQLATRSFDLLPSTLEFPRWQAVTMIGMGHHQVGETGEAEQFLTRVAADEPRGTSLCRQASLWTLGFIHLFSARPLAARQAVQQMLAAMTDGVPMFHAWGHYLYGLASYEVNLLAEAKEHFLAVDRLRESAHRLALLNSMLGLVLVDLAQGQVDTARDTLTALEALPDVAQNARALAIVRTVSARLALDAGDVDGAAYSLGGLQPPPVLAAWETRSFSPTLTRARLMIALGAEVGLIEATRLLDELDAAATAINDSVQKIGVIATRALVAQAQGDLDTALRFVEQAICLAAPGGLVRTFVDLGPPMQSLLAELKRRSPVVNPYVARLIDAYPSGSAPLQPATPQRRMSHVGPNLIETLTWREEEILKLLDARLSNKEIATSLQISAETVKKHTSNIYGKLMVSTRREASARAHALGLLPAVDTGPGTPPDEPNSAGPRFLLPQSIRMPIQRLQS